MLVFVCLHYTVLEIESSGSINLDRWKRTLVKGKLSPQSCKVLNIGFFLEYLKKIPKLFHIIAIWFCSTFEQFSTIVGEGQNPRVVF